MSDKTFTTPNLNNASTVEEKPTLGKKLSTARKAHNLSIADVANELHLMASVIEKMENNEFDAQAPIFMRGYLRSYAKLVGVDEDAVSAAMSEIANTPPLITKDNNTRKTKSKQGKKRIVKIAFYLAIVIILVLLGNMWHKTPKSPGAIITRAQQKEQSKNLADAQNTTATETPTQLTEA